MQEIKDWLKSHKILPKLSFKDRREHIVEIVKCKAESFTNERDEFVDGMKFLVLEGGEPKTFFTASRDLLLKLADCAQGEIYKIKMVAKSVGGVIKTSYEVSKIEGEQEIQIGTDEIPVIEGDEPSPEELEKVFGK